MLRNKNEGMLSGFVGQGENMNQFEIQASYSPLQNIGIQFNYASYEGGNSGIYTGNGYLTEGGMGYYMPIRPNLVWDVYGLYGKGMVVNKSNNQQEIWSKFDRYGIQQGLGFVKKIVELNYSMRLMKLQYTSTGGEMIYNYNSQHEYLVQNSGNFLFEQAITIRVGYEPIKAQYQVVTSKNITNNTFLQNTIGMSFGLVLSLNRVPKTNKTKK